MTFQENHVITVPIIRKIRNATSRINSEVFLKGTDLASKKQILHSYLNKFSDLILNEKPSKSLFNLLDLTKPIGDIDEVTFKNMGEEENLHIVYCHIRQGENTPITIIRLQDRDKFKILFKNIETRKNSLAWSDATIINIISSLVIVGAIHNILSSKNKPPSEPKLNEFKDLFRESENAQVLKDLLKIYGFIDKEYKWIGTSNRKTQLLAVYYTLKDLNLLFPEKVTPQATVLYNEFGLEVGSGKYITARALTDRPINEDSEFFEEILPKHFAME